MLEQGMRYFNFAIIIPLVILTSCSPSIIIPSRTLEIIPTQVVIPTSTQTLTQTPTPTETPTLIPTSTSTMIPTPDYSQIRLIGAHRIDNSFGSFTQIILEMGNIQGVFYGFSNNENYVCRTRNGYPSQLICDGGSVPFDKRMLFTLYSSNPDYAIFSTYYLVIDPNPTPIGMYCEIEGLWTDAVGHLDAPGCYAVTCWIDGKYYGGVVDSCVDYWPWIPPGLYPTPLPNH